MLLRRLLLTRNSRIAVAGLCMLIVAGLGFSRLSADDAKHGAHLGVTHPVPEVLARHGIPARVLADEEDQEGPHPIPLVDGAIDPAKIPDNIAFSLFLSTLNQYQPDSAAFRAYIATIMTAAPTPTVRSLPEPTNQMRGAVIGEVARTYGERARTLREANQYNPRGGLVDQARADLQNRLDPNGWLAVRHYVLTHVKSRTRIFNDRR